MNAIEILERKKKKIIFYSFFLNKLKSLFVSSLQQQQHKMIDILRTCNERIKNDRERERERERESHCRRIGCQNTDTLKKFVFFSIDAKRETKQQQQSFFFANANK